MKKLVRELVIGNKKYFDSWTEYRQVMLSGQFGLIAISGLIFYLVLDMARGYYLNIPVFVVSMSIILIAIRLHRLSHHCVANSILYPTLFIIIYLFTSSEAPANGGVVFYIPVAIGAFASFDFKHRKLALMMAGFGTFMFLASIFTQNSILPWRTYTEEEVQLNMLINFMVAMPTSLLAIYMLLRLNHRNAKQLVESNDLLKKSNEELDRFVYSSSHDLRAPLSSVLGLIHLSEKTNNMDESKKYLGMMKNRVHALESFIKDITDYSRNNRTEVSRSRFNLHQMSTEIWDSLKYNQKAEHIRFEIDFDQSFMIDSDPQRLRVILSNLISNSIRYHDTSKDNKFIRLHCKRTEKSFILSVEDNGQGIAPEYHKKIFNMFFRANETSTGSGLGLYIVSETLAKLSGQVQLQSAPRKGSTFTLNIPVRQYRY